MPERKKDQKPQLLTSGFVALDVVFGLEDPEPKFYAGGTMGNVTAGMAFLGWDVTTLGRLSDDAAGCFVRSDLEQWSVNTEHLGLKPNAPTPIVIERIELSKNAIPKHRFHWNCPDCGAFFPPYVPFYKRKYLSSRSIAEVRMFSLPTASRAQPSIWRVTIKQKGPSSTSNLRARATPSSFGKCSNNAPC